MGDTTLTDDYVASLVAKDAKESSIKYSALGMEAFLPAKPPVNKPKPNTRFLRNIIKETDSHNAALLAKEAAESKERLQNLEGKKLPGPADIRRRQLGLITAHLRGTVKSAKRKWDDKPDQQSRRRSTSSEEDLPNREEAEEKSSSSRTESSHRDRRYRDREYRDRGLDSHRSKRHRSRSKERRTRKHRSRSRSRSRSPREHRSKESRYHQKSSHRSSRREKHSEESISSGRHRSRRSPSPTESSSTQTHSNTKSRSSHSHAHPPTADSDSDPLDSIIGPRPPPTSKVRSRGRGLTSAASGIDSRFSENYDPQSDVALELEEENDWEQALEALRDRQKWKAQGAKRLRAAGFTEEQVVKWERGGEKSVADVQWAKKGEGREWDRGKVVDAEGFFGGASAGDLMGSKKVDASWGRLKGT